MKTICITGPESCGKSELTQALAAALNGLAVPEYARLYLEENGPDYQAEDLLQIARGQKRSEDAAHRSSSPIILLDTSFEVLRIWSEEVFGRVHPWIENRWQESHVDHYLLCYPDIPWTPDPFRENPHDRVRLFNRYKELLEVTGRPFSVVQGLGDARVACSIEALERAGFIK